MKRELLKIIVLFLILPGYLMAQNDERATYEHKIHVYSDMRKAGTLMVGLSGGLMLAGGVLFFKNTDEDPSPYGSTNNDDKLSSQQSMGIKLFSIGAGLFAGGLVIHSIASRKRFYYNTKLTHLTASINYLPNSQGISLILRF